MLSLKICRKCNIEKKLSLFFKESSIKNGYRATCKKCCYERRKELELLESFENKNKRLKRISELKKNRVKNNQIEVICKCCSKKFYPKRKDKNYCTSVCRSKGTPEIHAKRIVYAREKYKKNMVWLENYKLSRGCIDCGYNSNSEALQLDHEGVKTAEIANLRHNIIKLQDEIEKGKCVVRCANCHAIKTRERKNNKK